MDKKTKKKLQRKLRTLYPNIPWVKKRLAKTKIDRYRAQLIDPERIREGEKGPAERDRILEALETERPRSMRIAREHIAVLLENAPCYQGREDREELRRDMEFCWFAYGFNPDEYLCYDLEGRSPEERKAFVSNVDRYGYAYRMNDISDMQIFNDKVRTYGKYAPFYHRDAVCVSGPKDLAAYRRFIEKHPVFVKKAVFESMGRSVELVDLRTLSMSPEAYFESLIAKGKHQLEERVVQSEAMAALNSSSVNTVRCITMNTRHGIEAPYCFMKIGRSGSFVDNGGAGGILVGIDQTTGRLDTDGYDEYMTRYEKHPDSGIVFRGYPLPDVPGMVEICKRMSAMSPTVKYIGWDMAHTADGWVIIEGNGVSQLIGPQIVWRRSVKEEVLAIMKDMDLIV